MFSSTTSLLLPVATPVFLLGLCRGSLYPQPPFSSMHLGTPQHPKGVYLASSPAQSPTIQGFHYSWGSLHPLLSASTQRPLIQ